MHVCEQLPLQTSMRQQDFQASHWQSMTLLWRQQLLCDVQLRASSGELLSAHSVVLASSSGFFRALLCGAGRSMREGCLAASSHLQAQQPSSTAPASTTSCATMSLSAPFVVDLPYSAQQLAALLDILYEHNLEVHSHNVSWLLDMASYLEVPPLQEACCMFLRSALATDACVDVLLLAHHYHCSQLQAEAVESLAKRLSCLLVMPESRQGLLRLPEPLLRQLLCSEALDVEQESELLCFLSDWVCHSAPERQQHLPQLLHLLKLSALPQEQLMPQQLQACSGPQAAALAQQLYSAAHACQASHSQQNWQQQQPTQVLETSPRRQQQVMRRQAGSPVAGTSSSGQCLAGSSDGSASSSIGTAGRAGPTQGAVGGFGTSSDPTCTAGPAWWDPAGASGAADLNNQSFSGGTGSVGATLPSCSNNAAVLGAHETSRADGGALQRVWDVSDCCGAAAEHIGAVVAQAWPGRQRGYQPASILVAGGHETSWRGLKAVELYDPVQDTWRSGPMLPVALPFAGAGVATRGQVYVIGGAMCSNHMACLDIASEEWRSCEAPSLSRLHAGVTGTAGLLYVTGGRTQVNVVVSAVEAYDHVSSTWQSLPDMLQPRYAHAAVAQGGCLYALGGQASKAIHRTVEVYDPQRGTWQALGAQLTSERKYCAAASLGGRLLVLGGMNEARRRLSSLEAYDPREGRWTQLTSMQHARSSCSVACVGGRLYVMGGSTGHEALHGGEPCTVVEVYDPLTGSWANRAPLSCGRSGLAAVAV